MTTAPAIRRGFTLLEVMLALALSSIVALSAYGLFEVIRRSERRQFIRMAETDEVARTYKALERAFKSLVMSDRPFTGEEKELQDRMRAFERAVDNGDPDPPVEDDEPEPRMIIRSDPMSPLLEVVNTDGQRQRMKAQIVEVALRTPPVLGARPDTRLFERYVVNDLQRRADERARRERERERDSADDTGEATDTEAEEEEHRLIAPGVRGIFEIVPDGIDPLGALGANTGLEGWEPRPTAAPGWTLWWRELPPPPPEDDAAENSDEEDATPRRATADVEAEYLARMAATRRIPLLTGLRWIRWEVYRGKRFDTRTRATWREELPAFVKVDFETVEGRRENWMFEVAWTFGPEPGSEINASSLPSRPAVTDPRTETAGSGSRSDRRDRPTAIRGRNNSSRDDSGGDK